MTFLSRLRDLSPDPAGRTWVYVPYDQLTDGVGPLASTAPDELGIVLVESPWKARRRPYHKQKLATLLANQRHFALEQAARGVAVDYLVHDGPYLEALGRVPPKRRPLLVMEPAERELRLDLRTGLEGDLLEQVPHEGWLTSPEEFREACGPRPPWKLDTFYRSVRRSRGFLMEGDAPVGGTFSLDAENRKPWKGEPPAPTPPRFEPDAVTAEVFDMVASRFAHHPGELDPGAIPSTHAQVEELWSWVLAECMEHFGPFEDAMSATAESLFHTRISPLLNLHRLLPRRVVQDVLALDIPLPSKEGFLRQVLGWREFVRHVHRETDGFRDLPDQEGAVAPAPGDGGWGRWTGRTWEGSTAPGEDGGAAPTALGARREIPVAFWGEPSGLRCLDTVVDQVWREGWSHHITRLMVLSNLATLLGVSPRELTDWFWVAYVDAYDWVVEPNVLGMGTFGVGPVMSTKPYVSGAAYIHKMSDYCGACRFDPRKSCPITPLYWDRLGHWQEALASNPRMALPLAAQRRRDADRRQADSEVARETWERLRAGRVLEPEG